MPVRPGKGGGGGGSAGVPGLEQRSLGVLELGVGSTVYTSNGAKSEGGIDFELFGTTATNTWEVDGDGMTAVGGSGVTYAVIELAAHFPTLDLSLPFSAIARLSDGTILTGGSGAEIFFYMGSLTDRLGVVRNGIEVEAVYYPGGGKANFTLAGTTDVSAIGVECRARGVTARYWLRGETVGAPAGGHVGRATARDSGPITDSQAVIGFIGSGARGKTIESIEVFQDVGSDLVDPATVQQSSFQPLAYAENSDSQASGITLVNNNDGTVDVTITAGTPAGRTSFMWWVCKTATGKIVDPSDSAKVCNVRVRGEVTDKVGLDGSGVSVRFGNRAASTTGNGWSGGLHYDSGGIYAHSQTCASGTSTPATSGVEVGSEAAWEASAETYATGSGVAAYARMRTRALLSPKEAMKSPAGANQTAQNDFNFFQEFLALEVSTENLIGGSDVTFTLHLDASCEEFE